jgi:hypothetical protein
MGDSVMTIKTLNIRRRNRGAAWRKPYYRPWREYWFILSGKYGSGILTHKGEV